MSLEPDCLVQLKLRQPPFDAVPSEEFLYSDPLLESLIETASRALQAAGAIVILAGAEGSGRSVQLMRLLGALEDGLELIAFRGRANIPFDAIDATIRSHLRAGGLEDPRRTLADLLGERARAGSALVLAIDDAHLIGAECIRNLLHIRTEILELGGLGLRLILVGDPSFSRASLPLPDPVDDSQVVRLNMRPFNLEQAGAYLRHRLRMAGVEDPETFLTSGDIAVLQTNSKGLPDALNKSANAWLARRCRSAGGFAKAPASAPLPGLAPPVPAPPRARRALVVDEPPDEELRALVDAGSEVPEGLLDLDSDAEPVARRPVTDPELAKYLVGEDVRPQSEDLEQILRRVRQHQVRASPASKAPAAPSPATTAGKPPYWSRPWLIPVLVLMVGGAIGVPVALQLWRQAPESSPRPPAQTTTKPESPLVTDPRSPSIPTSETARKPEAAVPSVDQAVPLQPARDLADTAAGGDLSAVGPPSVPASAEASMQTPPAQSQPAPAQPQPQPQPQTAATAAAEPGMAEDLDWLMRQEPERFTIQLVAASDLATSKGVLAAHGLDGVHYVKTRSYVVALFGSFPNRAVAASALTDLPQAVRDSGPWIRTIGSVRSSLPSGNAD